MEAYEQTSGPTAAMYPPNVVSDLPPLNAALVGLDTAIEQTEKLAALLEERLGQILRDSVPGSPDRLSGPRYGVPYADSLVGREERLSLANERIGYLIDRLGV